MELPEYTTHCDQVMWDFKNGNKTKFLNWDDVCRHLLPVDEFDAINRNVAAEAAAHLKFRLSMFLPAMKRRAAQIQKDEAQQDAMARSHQSFGGSPQNAREATGLFVRHNGISFRYDGTCYERGKATLPSKVEGALLLTAEAAGYTIGDARTMSNAALKLAWAEHMDYAREQRKLAVWDQIATTDPITAHTALLQLRDLCEHLMVEPEFSFWAIVKWIWQVKRRLQGLYIKDHHFLVLRGMQGSGKTELAREILRPVQEIACEASLAQILDERNFLTRSMFVAFPDELARAERSDLNEIKTVVTGATSTSRVLYSHNSQRNPVNLSIIGTADKPVSEMMSDTAGMRRVVEAVLRAIGRRRYLDWEQDVVGMPWQAIWQAVDHTTADPLMSRFADVLRAKQESMRRRTNVEAWLESWEFDPQAPPNRRTYVAGEYVEFAAKDLYTNSFRMYEDRYHPGSPPTSVTSWGTKFSEMIDDGIKLPRWSYRKSSNNKLYRYELGDELEWARGPGLMRNRKVAPEPEPQAEPGDFQGYEGEDEPREEPSERYGDGFVFH